MMNKLVVLVGTLFILSSTYASNRLRMIMDPSAPVKDQYSGSRVCTSTSLHAIDIIDIFESGFSSTGSCGGMLKNQLSGFKIKQESLSSERSYSFHFEEYARQQIRMKVYENANKDGKDSEWSMLTTLIFIPRNVVPHIDSNIGGGQATVVLPTGESVQFNTDTGKIIGGVLTEGLMDRSSDRHARKFVKLNYTGAGYMIRTDQRGDSPEKDPVWGQDKYATITRKGKSCKVRVRDLWDQSNDNLFKFKFATDLEFARFLAKYPACHPLAQ